MTMVKSSPYPKLCLEKKHVFNSNLISVENILWSRKKTKRKKVNDYQVSIYIQKLA